MKRLMGCASVVAMIAATTSADARVTRIEITKQESFAAGATFGSVGAYEKVIGRYHGELDPKSPLNAVIVDLDKAPRNARGMVEYSADFYILKPVDLDRGNGALFYELSNRGNKGILARFNDAAGSNDPSTAQHAGNGFLMQQGYTLLWNGWMTGLPAANNALRIELPIAANQSGPIVETVWDELLFNETEAKQARLSFKATSTDKSQATLYVREHNSEEPTVIAADKWEFVDAQTVRLLPAGTPFKIGAIYQLIYKAANPPVAGIGLASTRDFVSFARYATADDAGTPNPLAAAGRPALNRVLSQGNSQSGRYLRDFIYSGFNEDEAHRIVFEGSIPTVASGRMFLNYRFAQPGRINPAGHGFMFFPGSEFPFAYENQTDPFTGKNDGILNRCTASKTCPKVVHLNSGTEFWQAGQSLVTTDPLGQRDTTPPDNVRIWSMTSIAHQGVNPAMPKGVCAMPYNLTDYRPLMRAALVALDRWVKDGKEPPASRYPRIADGTLVPAVKFNTTVPGFAAPRSGPNPKPRLDFGPDIDKGIIGKALPVVLKDQYRVLVPAVDADGNETAGLRLPDITVPTGTAMGWSVRSEFGGGTGELCYLDGAFIPFAKTKAEREASKDPRPSLEERYKDAADYAERVKQTATALERDGYLLPQDVKRIVERAAKLSW
jgi:Alpha/beta hydrolase domain